MHPEVQQQKPGHCPKCGMQLVEKDKENKISSETKNSYMPLITIISIILLVSLTLTAKDILGNVFLLSKSLSYFMIGFFVTFSGFKLVDLKGFAEGYSTYDLLAKKWFSYGYIYPFIELFFAFAMILRHQQTSILLAEVVIMTFSGIGVAIKLVRHEKFQCACLGTFLKVPLTYVTLVEDFGMAALALLMLLIAT